MMRIRCYTTSWDLTRGYGSGEREINAYALGVRELVDPFGAREMSREAGVSVRTVSTVKR